MTQAMVNNITGTAILVLAVVMVGMIVWARWVPKPPHRRGATQVPPAATSPGAGAQAPTPPTNPTLPTQKKFWKTKPFFVALALLAAGALAFVVYQMSVTTNAGQPIAWGLIFGLLAIIFAFIAGFILLLIGKKSGELLIWIAVFFFGCMILINWFGQDNVDKAGKRIGASLASGTFDSTNACQTEQLVTLLPGEPTTVQRDHNCGLHMSMRWKPKVSATIDVVGMGNIGPYHYVRYPNTPSSFEYEGVTESLTLTNLGEAPTSALIFYE